MDWNSNRVRAARRFCGRAAGLIAWLALVTMAGAGLSCGRPQGAEPARVVRIGYFANLTHAQAVLGVASGDYERAVAPAKLEAKVFNAGPSLIEALFAGEIDIGYVGPGPTLSAQARSHGQGIRVVSGAAANGVVIVARKDSGIVSLKQLAGKRVATPQLGNTQDISARHYLSKVIEQPDLNNVTPIDNAQQAALFSRNELDAAWVPEPWGQLLVSQTGATLLAEEKDLWPEKEFALTVVVTTPEFLSKHADAVENVLASHRSWTRRLTQEPSKYASQLGDALFGLTGKRLDRSIVGPALERVKFTDDPHDDTLRTFATWTHDLGFEREVVDLNGLVDTKILSKLRAESP
jgi:NitT/TauT family transport system substrate-binding protein